MKIINHRLCGDTGMPVPYQMSPNHGGQFVPASGSPLFLLIHYTAGRSAQKSADWLCNPNAKASANVTIGKDAKCIQLVPFNTVSWHAGESSWTGKDRTGKPKTFEALNRYSLSIELDNPGPLVKAHDAAGKPVWRSLSLGTSYPLEDGVELTHKNESKPCGWHVYPDEQLDMLFEVAHALVQEYKLIDVLGHDDVAPTRKRDPGPAFAMDSFRSKLFGRADV